MAKVKVKAGKTGTKRDPRANVPGPPGDDPRAREVVRWHERIHVANKIFDKWERKFQCKSGWDWYEGFQGASAHMVGDPEVDRYIINLIYPTVEVKIPGLYFHSPKANVIPRPSREDDTLTTLQDRAKLREDTVNTFLQDPRLQLKDHTDLALKETFFYFGVIEIGYSADYNVNPNAGKPILDGDREMMGEDDLPMQEPRTITTDEQLYVKRIPAHCFRVSARSEFLLKNCDWCGYYEWVYAEDLKKDPLIQNHDKIKATGKWDNDYTGKINLSDTTDSYSQGLNSEDYAQARAGMVKIWKIWDIRAKEFFIVPDEGDFFLQPPTPYKVFPFAVNKFHERKEGFYPMPPHFNWLSPQAELNDTREMQRLHRKRMTRRYQMMKNNIDPDELTKMESGGDGVVVQTNVMIPAIMPIEDAPLDFSISRNIPMTKDDFMQIANTGGDQRGVASSETATQATVIETRARIRESFGQAAIAAWVSEIARIMLETIEEYMALPFWIVRNVDPLSPMAAMEVMRVADIYQQITSDELGPLSYDVSVAAESLSPINEDVERQKFLEFLTLISANPILMLMLRTSDALLRKTMGYYGMRDEKTIQQVKLAIEVAMLAQTGGASAGLPQDPGQTGTNTMAAQGMAPGGGGAPAPGARAQPPGLPASVSQIRGQMGLK